MTDLGTMTTIVDEKLHNKIKPPITMEDSDQQRGNHKKEVIFLIDGSENDLVLFQKNTQQTAILLGNLSKANLIKIIDKAHIKSIVFLANNSWREIDKTLFKDNKDVSKPFFDRFKLVADFMEQLKANQGKEKDLFFYFYAIKPLCLNTPTNNLSELFIETKGLLYPTKIRVAVNY